MTSNVTGSHDVLLLVPLVIFAAYLVFGITGFGASPITIPVLVHLLPLAFVLPLAALLDLGSALARTCVRRPPWRRASSPPRCSSPGRRWWPELSRGAP